MRRPLALLVLPVLVLGSLALALALVLAPSPAAAHEKATDKEPPPALEAIRAAKARGERYPGMLWHAAEEWYRKTRAAAPGARLARRAGAGVADATEVASNPFVDADTTVGKGDDIAIGSCTSGGVDTAEDAWYVLNFDRPVALDLWTACEGDGAPASFDTRLAVFDADLALLDCNDDAPDCGQPWYQSRIEGLVLEPGTYYAVVDGYNGAAGPFELHASWVEDPVVCEGSNASTATPISTLPFVATDSTVGACDDLLVDCELATGTSGPDHWYRLDLDRAVLLDARTICAAGDLDARLAVLDADLQTLHCNDDDPLCPTYQPHLEDVYLDPGIHYLVVDGPAGEGGSYTVEVDTTHVPPGLVRDLLPDVVVIENDLYDNVLDTSIEPGRTHLRLSNATANLGEGELYLYGVAPGEPTPTHEVRQRIRRTDGSWYDRAAGQFVYHPGHNHIHIEGWAQYNLREILSGDGVGDVVASGTKTSFCILDLRVQDSSLPGFDSAGTFTTCNSTVQGLSVGWADVYSRSLPDQWIDVTDVPDGTYWLESVVDPADAIAELDESNNVARIRVTLGAPEAINPDAFEPNDDIAETAARPVGQNNSPHLGPCAPSRTLEGLTIESAGDDDVFGVYLPATGAAGDHVRIDFQHALGDLDLELLDPAGAILTASQGTGDAEQVELDGYGPGWVFVRVFGFQGATSPAYTLTVDPPSDDAPTLVVDSPPDGDTRLVQGIDSHPVAWTASDPEGDELWATVHVNTTPELGPGLFLLETSLHTPAALGSYVLPSTYLPLGTYHVYVELTDGGSVVGAWAPGTLTVVEQRTDTPPSVALGSSRLLGPTPNPFNPRTELRLDLTRDADLSWAIYDQRGALVRRLPAGHLHAGQHRRMWDGTDQTGEPVASGVYHAVVRGSGLHLTRKLVLLR